MKNIDLVELKRILKIKEYYDKDLISIDMIDPLDYEVINLLYRSEIESKESDIKQLKDNINNLYKTMEDMIAKVENNKK